MWYRVVLQPIIKYIFGDYSIKKNFESTRLDLRLLLVMQLTNNTIVYNSTKLKTFKHKLSEKQKSCLKAFNSGELH